jgi:hypothetical protein
VGPTVFQWHAIGLPAEAMLITVGPLELGWNQQQHFSLCAFADPVELTLALGVSMNRSEVNIRSEKDRPLNSISLQNAVLCADCDVISDSPHDHCLVCGSRSLFNISRLLGGMLPSQRAMLIENASGPFTVSRPVLKFQRTRPVFNSRDPAKVQRDTLQRRLFG